MNPEFIDSMSWEMAEVYGAITDQILINLAHYFPFWKPGQPVPKSSFEYQVNMLAQMGKINADTIKIIRNGLSGADDALQKVLEQAIIESVTKAQPELLEAVKQGMLQPEGIPVVSPNQMRAFKLYYQQSADGLNLVNTVMLESTKEAYAATVSDIVSRIDATQSALNIATGETITGISSWNQALKHATDRMKENGIVGFIDHAGRRWSAESYVSMDIRTTVANTARAATWETNQTFGNDLYQVSYHNGARPLCYPWQNKVISATDNARTVTDLDGNEIQVIAQSATTYGQAAGLFGINCKHYPTPFIPGVSIIRGEPQNEKDNLRTYAESQEQRRLERKLREQKRDVMMAKAQGAPESTVKALRQRANDTSDEIEEFCAQTGRTRRRNREGVYTKREFPDANTYDVRDFEIDQREKIEKYFTEQGGTQGMFTFDRMHPNMPPPTQHSAKANPAVSTFKPAKTVKEAQEYAHRFATNVNYEGMSVGRCNAVNEMLTELQERYPETQKLFVLKTNKGMGANARANFETLELNPQRLGTSGQRIFEDQQRRAVEGIERINTRFKGKNIPPDMKKQIARLEYETKFTRYAVCDQYGVRGEIAHEFGHIIADQYIGQINDTSANPNAHSAIAAKRRKMISDARQTAIKNGDIFNISKYGSTDDREFFAEVFCAFHMGEELPEYIYNAVWEVVNGGIV